MKILVVEDDPILALVSAAALADANHEIVGPAHDVVDAQELIATGNIDFAVVDINLAGKDEGIELLGTSTSGMAFLHCSSAASWRLLGRLNKGRLVCYANPTKWMSW